VRARLAELVAEPVRRRLAVIFGAANDLAADVVGDEREIAMLASPADLVHADLKQVVQPVGIKLIGADTTDDPPDGVPVDPDQPSDRALVGLRRQPRDQRLEIAGEPAGVPRERHALDPNPCSGQSRRLSWARSSRRQTPRSRWRQVDCTCWRLWRCGVEYEHSGHRNRRRRSATHTTTRLALNCTPRTQIPSRRSRRENPALTRIVVLLAMQAA